MILKTIIALITLTPLFTFARESTLEIGQWKSENTTSGVHFLELKKSEVIYNESVLELDEEKIVNAYSIPTADGTSQCHLQTQTATVIDNKIVVLSADYKRRVNFLEGLALCNTWFQRSSEKFGNPFRYLYEQIEVLETGDALSLTLRVRDSDERPDLSADDLLTDDLVANSPEIQEYMSAFPTTYYVRVEQNALTKF